MDIPEKDVENKGKKAKKTKISAKDQSQEILDFNQEAETFTFTSTQSDGVP